jgi:glycosyltransferase involved in cell wall biosynthesis
LLSDNRGWLVENGDVKALSKQIAYVLSHPEEAAERAHKAQQYAQARYSEQSIMPQWVKIVES